MRNSRYGPPISRTVTCAHTRTYKNLHSVADFSLLLRRLVGQRNCVWADLCHERVVDHRNSAFVQEFFVGVVANLFRVCVEKMVARMDERNLHTQRTAGVMRSE